MEGSIDKWARVHGVLPLGTMHSGQTAPYVAQRRHADMLEVDNGRSLRVLWDLCTVIVGLCCFGFQCVTVHAFLDKISARILGKFASN